jgi:hypothetical protein
MDNVGFTFGGGCFFGHGVSVSGGKAKFYVTSFTIKEGGTTRGKRYER